MKTRYFKVALCVSVLLVIVFAFFPRTARPHCDTLDGPVVNDARIALAAGDVTPVLKWVKPAFEQEIRAAFDKTVKVRRLNTEVKELADLYFFETLVRIHRAGEGAPYTGLKPAGTEMEPGVAAADQALAKGRVDLLVKQVNEDVNNGITHRFERVIELKKHANESVAAGRAYVEAYVEYIHFVERLATDATTNATEHAEGAAGGEHHE